MKENCVISGYVKTAFVIAVYECLCYKMGGKKYSVMLLSLLNNVPIN